MKKMLLILVALFCVSLSFADENDKYIEVKQYLRYLDETYADDLGAPQISISLADQKSGEEGSWVAVRYNFTVLKKTLWWRSDYEKVRAAIVVPKDLHIYPVTMSGCKLLGSDQGDDDGLPTYYLYNDSGDCCYWFTFSSGHGTSAFIEFLISVDNYNPGAKIPIKIKFWHLENINFRNPVDEPLMKSTNRTFNLFIKK